MQKIWIQSLVVISSSLPLSGFATDLQIYGRAHVSLDYLDDSQRYEQLALSSNSSRLGFKVEHKIDEQLTAFAQIEQQVNFSSGADDNEDSVDFATRDTFVGLKGDFGQLKVGRFDSPFKSARNPVNFFGDQVGDLRNVTRAYDHRFDERNPNTIEYQSPELAMGLVAKVGLSLHDGSMINHSSSEDNNEKSQAYDVALQYKNSGIDAALAYEKYQEDVSRGERDGIRAAAAYQVTPKLKLGALYQYTQHTQDVGKNADAHVYGLATEYKITAKTSARAHVLQRDIDADEFNSTLVALGLEHRFNKNLRIYGTWASMINQDNANLTPWLQARSNKPAASQGVDATGQTSNALSLGLRYDF